MSEQTNILIIKLGALGDVILAMEAFKAIRVHHPKATITVLTRAPFVGLIGGMPWIDDVITDLKPKLWQVGKCLEMRKLLQSGNYSRVYDLQCNDRTEFYHRLWGKNRPEWMGRMAGCAFPRPDFSSESLPVTERQLRHLAVAGVARAGSPELDWLDDPLADLSLPKSFVVMVPGCAPHRPEKRWPAEYYGQLALALREEGLETVLVGTKAEAEAIDTILGIAPKAISLAGKTNILQVGAVARRAKIVVGNDTGPMHIAGIVGAPTLVLMSGVTDPVGMLPRGPQVHWLQEEKLSDLNIAAVTQKCHSVQDV